MSLSTLMIRFTRIKGSCVVSSLPCAFLFALGGGVGVIKMERFESIIAKIITIIGFGSLGLEP